MRGELCYVVLEFLEIDELCLLNECVVVGDEATLALDHFIDHLVEDTELNQVHRLAYEVVELVVIIELHLVSFQLSIVILVLLGDACILYAIVGINLEVAIYFRRARACVSHELLSIFYKI